MLVQNRWLEVFRNDLCKDQREIEIFRVDRSISRSGLVLRKHSTSVEEYYNEQNVISFFEKEKIEGILRIIETKDGSDPYIDFEYYDGIRIFNVFAYIRRLRDERPDLYPIGQEIQSALYERIRKKQEQIQKALIKWAVLNNKHDVYPQTKLFDLIELLFQVFNSSTLKHNSVIEDVEHIVKQFNHYADTPFRDSTTKNMLLYYPKLYLGKFKKDDETADDADEERFAFFVQMLETGDYQDLLKADIIDFDFSSCEHLTTKYDDPIGLMCHEITYKGIPLENDILWVENNDSGLHGEEIAISFIIRYLRFGGRKLAYHIFHPDAYRYRFKYDDELFYFSNLNNIVLHFWPEAQSRIPNLLEFIDMIRDVIENKSETIIDNVDEFEKAFPTCSRKFYLDIYPY